VTGRRSPGNEPAAAGSDRTGAKTTKSCERRDPEASAATLAPFRQVDNGLARSYEGTGLGLPLAKTLVELHGGELLIESKLGEGTCVTVDCRPACAGPTSPQYCGPPSPERGTRPVRGFHPSSCRPSGRGCGAGKPG